MVNVTTARASATGELNPIPMTSRAKEFVTSQFEKLPLFRYSFGLIENVRRPRRAHGDIESSMQNLLNRTVLQGLLEPEAAPTGNQF